MPRRKKKTSIFAYAFGIIFLGFLILVFLQIKSYFPKVLNNVVVNQTGSNITGEKNTNDNLKVYVNSLLSGEGKIKQIPYNMQVATSYKLFYNKKEFFAKSDNYLLGNYDGQKIQFSGVIIGFSPDNLPVINITYIKEPENEEKQEENTSSKYANWKNLIVNLDVIADNLQILSTGKNLVIGKIQYLSGNNLSGEGLSGELSITIPYLKVSAFHCDRGNPMTDCEALQNQFKTLRFDKIINDNGVVFYKLPETNNYEVFSDEYGYYFYPLTGNFYSLINAFSIVNTKQSKLDAIKNTCVNDNIKLTNILDIKSSGNSYQVVGLDQNSNKILCKLTLTKSGNKYVAMLQSLDYLKEPTISEKELNSDDYLVYKSRAYGFSVYMPKWVKYKSDLVNEDFGISGLNCLQIVNIAHRKKGTLSDPDIKVYYCKSQVSKYLIENGLSISGKNFKIISNADKIFIIFYKNTETAQKIFNYLKVF